MAEEEKVEVGEVEDVDPEVAADAEDESPLDNAPAEAFPPWVKLPKGMQLPQGKQVFAVQFRAAWTDKPGKGDRQCLLWNLTEADEKFALKRCRGEVLRTLDELTKQMVRAVDGVEVNWLSVKPDEFWNDIGGKCRSQLKSIYTKRHSFQEGEAADFLSNCVAARTAGG
jgi:hypothetical protein